MARFTTEAGIDDLTGKFSKHSRLVMRKKEEMVTRHMAQLKGTPDPVSGKKRICQFGNFVRAVLVREGTDAV